METGEPSDRPLIPDPASASSSASQPPAPNTEPSVARAAFSWLRDLTLSVVIAIIIILFLYQPVKVEGTSMMPSLVNEERIFINKFVYRFSNIERGDTVVFQFPRDTSKSYIKRVIGMPGDTVTRRSTGRCSSTAKRSTKPTCLPRIPRRGQLRRDQGRAGSLLRAGRPPQLLQRQPQLGHGEAGLHLREGGLRLLAPGPSGPASLTARGGRDRIAKKLGQYTRFPPDARFLMSIRQSGGNENTVPVFCAGRLSPRAAASYLRTACERASTNGRPEPEGRRRRTIRRPAPEPR